MRVKMTARPNEHQRDIHEYGVRDRVIIRSCPESLRGESGKFTVYIEKDGKGKLYIMNPVNHVVDIIIEEDEL